MARGGKRPGAGRKTGSVSKLSSTAAAAEFQNGITPLEFMTALMRDASQPFNMRLDAAKAAAPYMHPRLTAVEVTDKNEKPVDEEPLSTLELAKRLAFVLRTAQEERKKRNSEPCP